jgi:membrane associated rhomboid family serine protease
LRALSDDHSNSTPESDEAHGPLVEVGRYARLADARERGLVISARELPYWLDREGNDWVLRVEESAGVAVQRELASFEAEEQGRPPPISEPMTEKVETLSLYVAAWVMSGFFVIQGLRGAEWLERGAATSDGILLRGELWRTVTALTLHGDLSHFAANFATALLFARFVLPLLGTGCTWLAIVASGALGNAFNAWGYRGESHASIGASTAVFGALGILVGAEFIVRLSSAHGRSRWQLVLPIGAGLALLAFLGTGGEERRVDVMAHFWGFVVGLPLGALAIWLGLKARLSVWMQRAASLAALGVLMGAWWVAWR